MTSTRAAGPAAAGPPEALAPADRVLPKAGRENFPVAALVLPRAVRERLLAVYGFARLVDDTGDLAPGDRSALLDWLEADLDRAFQGEAQHPLMRRITPLVRELAALRDPFIRLIEANRQDQVVSRYRTFAQLSAYCELSANPVGQLVLHVLGAATPQRVRWSDAVCTGLQLAEHWQDVGEDFRAGRIYLPQEDLERFGVTESELTGPRAGDAFGRLMAFEVERARTLLAEGVPLVGSLAGRGRFAVAAFVGGGRAALDAVERSGYDVLARSPRASKAARLAATLRVLREARTRSPAVEDGYRRCRAIARRSATNFYYGMRLLPGARRDALYAVYAFARRVDDVADGDLSGDEKLSALADLRGRARDLASSGDDPVFSALADATARFGLPLDALEELVEGAEMDVRGTAYETFEDLLPYCRRVAGTIGRLSLAVFQPRDRAAAEPRAVALGVAFQLTNILRDVREDLEHGRVYLPREDVERFGCRIGPEGTRGPLPDLIRFEAERARRWLDDGLQLLPLLDRSSAVSVATMAGIYGRLLERIEQRPDLVLEGRLSLAGREKAWIAARSLLRAA